MRDLNEARPRRATEGDAKNTGGRSENHSLTFASDLARLARRHIYAALVVYERADRVVCSQVCTSLAAAERKVLRTRERGLSASLTLVRLVPVPATIPAELVGMWGDER